jgi:hypothetical protein
LGLDSIYFLLRLFQIGAHAFDREAVIELVCDNPGVFEIARAFLRGAKARLQPAQHRCKLRLRAGFEATLDLMLQSPEQTIPGLKVAVHR